MPITPFHFGPGLLFKGASRHVSLSAFVVVNVLIDIEPVVAFLLTGDPMHRFMHTYLGASLVAFASAVFAKKPVERWLGYWNSKLSPRQVRWLGCEKSINTLAFWIGAIAGGWSHIWLDAFMHVDVEPWWPLAGGNPSQGWIGISMLHILCVVAGIAGVVLLAWRQLGKSGNLGTVYPKSKIWGQSILRRLFDVFLAGSKLFFLVALLSIVLIGYDVSRTESSLNDLYNQLRNGVSLADLTLPTHGRKEISASKDGNNFFENICIRIIEKPGGEFELLERGRGRLNDVPIPREQVFGRFIGLLRSFPECRSIEIFIHQSYGFMWGILRFSLDADGKISNVESPRIFD